MKQLPLLILTFITLSVNAQKKNVQSVKSNNLVYDTAAIKYDTVQVSSDYLIRMDSATYVQFVQWVGSIPPNISKAAAYFYSAIDGSGKNVQKFPQYALKPRKK